MVTKHMAATLKPEICANAFYHLSSLFPLSPPLGSMTQKYATNTVTYTHQMHCTHKVTLSSMQMLCLPQFL